MYSKNAYLRSIILIICSSIIISCKGCGGFLSFKPTGIPLKVSVNTEGEISLSVEGEVEIPTPLGVLEIGLTGNPAEYFGVENTLTVRLNGQEHIYDLHGYDFDLQFEPGYYKKVNVSKNGSNLVLELTQSENPIINFKEFDWTGRLLFVNRDNVAQVTSSGNITTLFVISKKATLLRWSPNGKYIAYTDRDINGKYGLFVMDSDGRNGRTILLTHSYLRKDEQGFNVAPFDGDIVDMTWSSDSRQVLFLTRAPLGWGNLGLIDIDSGQVEELGTCGDHGGMKDVAWLSETGQIALSNEFDRQVWVRSLDDSTCEEWLDAEDNLKDFPEWHVDMVFLDNNTLLLATPQMLWRISKPRTSPVSAIRVGDLEFSASESPTAMEKSPDGRFVAINTGDLIIIFDTITGDAMRATENIDGYIEHDSLGWLP